MGLRVCGLRALTLFLLSEQKGKLAFFVSTWGPKIFYNGDKSDVWGSRILGPSVSGSQQDVADVQRIGENLQAGYFLATLFRTQSGTQMAAPT